MSKICLLVLSLVCTWASVERANAAAMDRLDERTAVVLDMKGPHTFGTIKHDRTEFAAVIGYAAQGGARAASGGADSLYRSQLVTMAAATDIEVEERSVHLSGQEIVLRTADLELVEEPQNWRAKILSVLADPTLAYILMLLGIYGIIFEAASPGAFFPGVVGGISLLLALFALNMLPINVAGIGLVLFGIGLMTAEAFVPSFGVLGIGGVVAFGFGSLFMFDEVPAVFVKAVVRRFYAASLISGALVSRSGLSQTGPAGCQFRILPDQRFGFCARASA